MPLSSSVRNTSATKSGLVPYNPQPLALGESEPMRIPRNDLKSTVFICEDRKGDSGVERVPVATAFFVNLPSESNPSIRWNYVVTTRHAIGLSEKDTFYVRVNRRDQAGEQGYEDFPVDRDQWRLHESADVAAALSLIPEPSQGAGLEYLYIPIDSFIGPGPEYKYTPTQRPYRDPRWQLIMPSSVQVGDDIFAVGLFIPHYAGKKSLPIARFGHISRMPDVVNIEIGKGFGGYIERMDVVAYLAEFMSWGGISGSPVSWIRKLEGTEFYGRALLGLVTGHFNISRDVKQPVEYAEKMKVEMNSGIAIVTPAEAVRELLMTSAFSEDRQRRTKSIEAKNQANTEVDHEQSGK